MCLKSKVVFTSSNMVMTVLKLYFSFGWSLLVRSFSSRGSSGSLWSSAFAMVGISLSGDAPCRTVQSLLVLLHLFESHHMSELWLSLSTLRQRSLVGHAVCIGRSSGRR